MGHAQKYVSWFLIFFLDIPLYDLTQRSVTGLIALDDISRPFVDGYQVVILIQHLKILRIAKGFCCQILILLFLAGEIQVFDVPDILRNGITHICIQVHVTP